MAWIPSALRDDPGEVQAALRGKLPALVTRADVRRRWPSASRCAGSVSS
jgi:hypothetical protein